MSDRTIQVALLVVAMSALTAALIALALSSSSKTAPAEAVLLTALTAVVGGLLTLIARNGGAGTPPKP